MAQGDPCLACMGCVSFLALPHQITLWGVWGRGVTKALVPVVGCQEVMGLGTTAG